METVILPIDANEADQAHIAREHLIAKEPARFGEIPVDLATDDGIEIIVVADIPYTLDQEASTGNVSVQCNDAARVKIVCIVDEFVAGIEHHGVRMSWLGSWSY